MAYNSLISIIIPTYNRKTIISKTLQSLKEQDEKGLPFEVIVIDDGSNDKTANHLSNKKFPFPFKLIRQKHKGPAAARNTGLKQARGNTVLFLNDDCLAAPDLLFQHRLFRERYGECAVLGQIKWSSQTPLVHELEDLVNTFYFPYKKIFKKLKLSFHYFITGNLSMPLNKALEAGGFDETFKEAAFEDIELGYRLQQVGLPLNYNKQAIAYHYHKLNFDELYDRQKKVAYWLSAFIAKHPEVSRYYSKLYNIPFVKKESYAAIINYAMYRGIQEGKKHFASGK